jgi:hypothetical protein
MARPHAVHPAAGPKSRRRASPGKRLAHDLANSLGALRLRLDLVTRDPACLSAQGPNLEAMTRILDDARSLATRLEAQMSAPNGRGRPAT